MSNLLLQASLLIMSNLICQVPFFERPIYFIKPPFFKSPTYFVKPPFFKSPTYFLKPCFFKPTSTSLLSSNVQPTLAAPRTAFICSQPTFITKTPCSLLTICKQPICDNLHPSIKQPTYFYSLTPIADPATIAMLSKCLSLCLSGWIPCAFQRPLRTYSRLKTSGRLVLSTASRYIKGQKP